VTAWHERFPPQTQAVEVPSGKIQDVDFVLSVQGLPEIK